MRILEKNLFDVNKFEYSNGWIDFDKFEIFKGTSYKTIALILFTLVMNINLIYLKCYFRHTISLQRQ